MSSTKRPNLDTLDDVKYEAKRLRKLVDVFDYQFQLLIEAYNKQWQGIYWDGTVQNGEEFIAELTIQLAELESQITKVSTEEEKKANNIQLFKLQRTLDNFQIKFFDSPIYVRYMEKKHDAWLKQIEPFIADANQKREPIFRLIPRVQQSQDRSDYINTVLEAFNADRQKQNLPLYTIPQIEPLAIKVYMNPKFFLIFYDYYHNRNTLLLILTRPMSTFNKNYEGGLDNLDNMDLFMFIHIYRKLTDGYAEYAKGSDYAENASNNNIKAKKAMETYVKEVYNKLSANMDWIKARESVATTDQQTLYQLEDLKDSYMYDFENVVTTLKTRKETIEEIKRREREARKAKLKTETNPPNTDNVGKLALGSEFNSLTAILGRSGSRKPPGSSETPNLTPNTKRTQTLSTTISNLQKKIETVQGGGEEDEEESQEKKQPGMVLTTPEAVENAEKKKKKAEMLIKEEAKKKHAEEIEKRNKVLRQKGVDVPKSQVFGTQPIDTSNPDRSKVASSLKDKFDPEEMKKRLKKDKKG